MLISGVACSNGDLLEAAKTVRGDCEHDHQDRVKSDPQCVLGRASVWSVKMDTTTEQRTVTEDSDPVVPEWCWDVADTGEGVWVHPIMDGPASEAARDPSSPTALVTYGH